MPPPKSASSVADVRLVNPSLVCAPGTEDEDPHGATSSTWSFSKPLQPLAKLHCRPSFPRQSIHVGIEKVPLKKNLSSDPEL